MKKIFLCILIFLQFCTYVQGQTSLELFLSSFPLVCEEKIITFEDIIQNKQNPIEKVDALTYIYNGDSTRLVCRGVYMNMENEEITGHYTDSVLPCKIGKIEIGKTIFAFYTTNDCQNERDFWWVNGEMAIYENGILQDKYIIYRANEYEAEVNSILSTNKNILFIQRANNERRIEYKLLKLSENKPYITVVKSTEQNKGVGDLFKALETLGWKEGFGSE